MNVRFSVAVGHIEVSAGRKRDACGFKLFGLLVNVRFLRVPPHPYDLAVERQFGKLVPVEMSDVNELSFASRLEDERFPQTFVTIEGDLGSLQLGPDYRIAITTAQGTSVETAAPPHYAWADPRYQVVHASIPACHANLVSQLTGTGHAETTALDNLRTLRLVEACYQSALAGGAVVKVGE